MLSPSLRLFNTPFSNHHDAGERERVWVVSSTTRRLHSQSRCKVELKACRYHTPNRRGGIPHWERTVFILRQRAFVVNTFFACLHGIRLFLNLGVRLRKLGSIYRQFDITKQGSPSYITSLPIRRQRYLVIRTTTPQ